MKRALIGIVAVLVAVAGFWLVHALGASPRGGAEREDTESAALSRPASAPGPLHASAPAGPEARVSPPGSFVDEPGEDDDDDDENDPAEEARRARAAVLSAIRGNHPTPAARRAAMLAALRASGPTDAGWTAQADSVFAAWSEAIPASAQHTVNRTSLACFRAGCEVRVTFPDSLSEQAASSAFRKIRDVNAQHGGRVLTPPDPVGEEAVEVSWIMMAPIEEISR